MPTIYSIDTSNSLPEFIDAFNSVSQDIGDFDLLATYEGASSPVTLITAVGDAFSAATAAEDAATAAESAASAAESAISSLELSLDAQTGFGSNVSFTYNGSNISTITETINGLTRTSHLDYNINGNISTVTIEFNGVRRIESYTYDGSNNILNINVTEENI